MWSHLLQVFAFEKTFHRAGLLILNCRFRDCLTRVLDHRLTCPLCVSKLSVGDYFRGTTAVLDQAIQFLFPKERPLQQGANDEPSSDNVSLLIAVEHTVHWYTVCQAICTLHDNLSIFLTLARHGNTRRRTLYKCIVNEQRFDLLPFATGFSICVYQCIPRGGVSTLRKWAPLSSVGATMFGESHQNVCHDQPGPQWGQAYAIWDHSGGEGRHLSAGWSHYTVHSRNPALQGD